LYKLFNICIFIRDYYVGVVILGFCFVEYFTHDHAAACLKFISGTICDDRIIRCELDAGFKPGRQFGRGASGGQIRDERRQTADPARGGVVNNNQYDRNSNRNSSSLGKRGGNDRGPIIRDDMIGRSSEVSNKRDYGRDRNREDDSYTSNEYKAGIDDHDGKKSRNEDDDNVQSEELYHKNPRFRDDNDERDNEAEDA
jgi:nuclear cap-binding protein subunit 2